MDYEQYVSSDATYEAKGEMEKYQDNPYLTTYWIMWLWFN